MDHAYPGAGKHGDDELGDHGKIDRSDIALFEAEALEDVGEPVHFPVQIPVGENLPVIGVVAFKDDGGLVLLRLQVPVQAVVAGVQLAALKPFDVEVVAERPVGDLLLVEGLEPGKPFFGLFRPEGVRVFDGLLVELFVLFPALDVRFFPYPVRHRKYFVVEIGFVSVCHSSSPCPSDLPMRRSQPHSLISYQSHGIRLE
ncbi:MAG: hypothetical protein A4E61_01036 [Syntrophorhabdus sp. PtaB.Bin184]|nr:MAG: hypothetical protein A4E61_01036 [Syntrophorhabdus sp. PtaB.Bin184]